MSDVTLTPQQSTAINARGSSVLVSAGAGSGKTFVLVQRLMSRILDEDAPANIDDFLIITYTRAAASELKGRILSELGKMLAKQPLNRHLQKQLQRVHNAKIGTAHAFCASLLREWASRLDLDPSFRIMDEDESSMMLEKLCSRLLDERYEEGRSEFFRLSDTIGSGRDDAKLAQSTISLFKKLQSMPSPEEWILNQKNSLLSPLDDPSDTPWGKSLMARLAEYARHCAGVAKECLAGLFLAPDIESKYAPALSDDISCFEMLVKRFEDGANWDDLSSAASFDFTSFKPVRNPSIPELKDRVSSIRKAYKDEWSKRCEIFKVSAKAAMEDITKVNTVLCELLDLTLELSRRFSERKSSQSIMDYSDLEHITLRLLTDQNFSSAAEVSSRFTEVLVDEYQDTNEIQDSIFNLISDNGRKLFMVGDVKQSIYRFRLAEPEIFINKYSAFNDFNKAEKGESIRIDLNSNFRSDPEVLSFVNRVFMNTMTASVGGVDYSDRDALHPHNPPTGRYPSAFVNVIDTKGLADDDGVGISRGEAEVMYTVKCIDELIRSGNIDGEPIKPGDIAILLRSDKTLGPMYAAALSRYGIPSQTAHSQDPISSQECSALICLLRVIDNPRQDIPLVTVLHSPIGGFSAEDLAKMRVSCKDGSMYDALISYAAEDKKSEKFLELLSNLRSLSRILTCDELIWQIFCLTNMREIYGCMDNGEERKENLDAIYDYACASISRGHISLFLMLRDLEESIKKGFRLSGKSSENTNAVKIMSIHRSKGLEFPVVFVCDCAREFSRKDVEDSLLSHKKLGLAARYLDMDAMLSCDTVSRVALKEEILAEQLSEEMRILYVALTRAKKLLYMGISSHRAASMISKAVMGTSRPDDASSMADWILAATLKGCKETPTQGTVFKGPDFLFKYVSHDEITVPSAVRNVHMPEQEENTDRDWLIGKINETLGWEYPNIGSALIPSKITATQLKGRHSDAEAAQDAPSPAPRGGFDRPAFVSRVHGLSPAEKGTALHLAMQYIDYSRCSSVEGVKEEISRLYALEQLTKEQAESIPCEKIVKFFESSVGQRLMKGEVTLREFKFSLLRPASDYFPEAHEDDTILLQGVVDACFETEGKLCVLDFKTDNIHSGGEAERAAQYEGQIRAYGAALERILKKPVDKLLLYFFATDSFFEVKPQ